MPKSKKEIGVIYGTYGQWGQEFVEEWHERMRSTGLPIQFFAQKILKTGLEIHRINPLGKIQRMKHFLSGGGIKSFQRGKSLIEQPKNNFALLHFQNTHVALKLWKQLDPETALLFTFRGYDINVRPKKEEVWFHFLKEIFQRATILHFVSDALKNKAIEMGAPPEKCITIRRSVDLIHFQKSVEGRKKSSPKINILSVGRIAWEKGHIYALEALAKIKNEVPDFVWTIIGKGPELQISEINFHIERLQLGNNVRLLGYLRKDQIQEQYQKADIFLQPSLSEGLPNTILEASAMSLPVIASNAGGIPEAVMDGESGFLHDITNVDAMASDIKKLLNNSELRVLMGDTSRKIMEIEFNPKNEIEAWKNLYQKLKDRDTSN